MNIVIVSASTRIGRQTHKVALALEKALAKIEGINAIIVDLKKENLPLFEEVMARLPTPNEAISQTFDVLCRADAMLFVTPEYNGSYSVALQNMADHYPKVAFAKKAIGIVTVSSGAMGGMRAAMHLQQFILALWAIPSPQMLLVSSVQNKFDEQGHLLDENYTKSIDTFLNEFLWLAKALKEAR